jgi:hypothetical protein
MIAAKKNAFGRTHPRRHASNHTATRYSSPPTTPAPWFHAAIFGDFALPLGDFPNLKLYLEVQILSSAKSTARVSLPVSQHLNRRSPMSTSGENANIGYIGQSK